MEPDRAVSNDGIGTLPSAAPWHWLALGLICLAALFLRLHALGGPSLWFDERMSIVNGQGHMHDFEYIPRGKIIDPPDLISFANARPISEVLRSPEIAAPLHPLLLRAWRRVFGASDFQSRLPSVLASLAAILLLFDLARHLTSPGDALWACAIMAVAQPQIQYAQEARSYSLMIALGLAASAALARLYRYGPSSWRAAFLALSLTALLLTHYFAIGAIVGLAIWAAIYLRGPALRDTIIAGAVAGLVFGLFLEFQPTSKAGEIATSTEWLGDDIVGHWLRTAERLAILPAEFLNVPSTTSVWWAMVGGIAFILPWIIRRERPAMLWCGCYLLGGVGLVVGIDLWRTTSALWHLRYVLVASPAIYLLLVLAVNRGLLRRAIPLVAILSCLLALPDTYQAEWKGEWRQLGADVNRYVRPGDILLFPTDSSVFLADANDTYEGVAFYSHIPCRVVLLNEKPTGDLLAQILSFRRIWFVSPGLSLRPFTMFPDWQANRPGGRWFNAGVLFQITPPVTTPPVTTTQPSKPSGHS